MFPDPESGQTGNVWPVPRSVGQSHLRVGNLNFLPCPHDSISRASLNRLRAKFAMSISEDVDDVNIINKLWVLGNWMKLMFIFFIVVFYLVQTGGFYKKCSGSLMTSLQLNTGFVGRLKYVIAFGFTLVTTEVLSTKYRYLEWITHRCTGSLKLRCVGFKPRNRVIHSDLKWTIRKKQIINYLAK